MNINHDFIIIARLIGTIYNRKENQLNQEMLRPLTEPMATTWPRELKPLYPTRRLICLP